MKWTAILRWCSPSPGKKMHQHAVLPVMGTVTEAQQTARRPALRTSGLLPSALVLALGGAFQQRLGRTSKLVRTLARTRRAH